MSNPDKLGKFSIDRPWDTSKGDFGDLGGGLGRGWSAVTCQHTITLYSIHLHNIIMTII